MVSMYSKRFTFITVTVWNPFSFQKLLPVTHQCFKTFHSFCKALVSLPQRMETLKALEDMGVYNCDALRSVPRMDTLTSLKRLRLDVPQDLTLSFSEGPFLPPNLQSISIESTRMTMPPITD